MASVSIVRISETQPIAGMSGARCQKRRRGFASFTSAALDAQCGITEIKIITELSGI